MDYFAYAKIIIFLFMFIVVIYAIPELLYMNSNSYSFVTSPFFKASSSSSLSVFGVIPPLSISANIYNDSLHPNNFSASNSNISGMLERGNIAMGFNHNKISHQFIPTPAGGIIRILALDSGDNKTIAQIKSHTRDIQNEFAEGNFTKPFFIHAQNVPGTNFMNQKKELIEYRINDMKNGSSLILISKDKELTKAINQFMTFQSGEHKRH